MIFYTLKGPRFTLEIHAEKIKLIRRTWSYLVTRGPQTRQWSTEKLLSFTMTKPHLLKLGKLEWQLVDGEKGSFRFTTNTEMVKRIERYMQERISKVEDRKNFVIPDIFFSASELEGVSAKPTAQEISSSQVSIPEGKIIKFKNHMKKKLPKKYRKRAA